MDRAGSVRGGIIGDDSRGAGLGEQHVLMTGALSFQGAGLPDVRWEEMEMEMEACSSIAQRSVHSAPELLLQLLAALHAAQQAKHDALRVARSAAAQPQLLLAGWRALQVAGPQHGRERDLSGRRGGKQRSSASQRHWTWLYRNTFKALTEKLTQAACIQPHQGGKSYWV